MESKYALWMVYAIIFFARPSYEEKQNVEGMYTRDITDYEKVIPVKVGENGQFDSYLLPAFYPASKVTRKREIEEQVHYKIPIGNDQFHVVLSPNRKLFPAGMTIETVGSDNSTKLAADNRQCHYTGYVKGKDGFTAALSTCHGLTGYIRTDKAMYLIEPVKDHDPLSGGEHPHIIMKRDEEVKESTCGTRDNFAEAIHRRDVERNDWSEVLKYKEEKTEALYLETMLALDWTFLKFHKDIDVHDYVMTVMNMAYNMFHDQSIGTLIHVSVVRIVKLEEEMDDMNTKVSKDADKTLEAFCEWQQKMNPRDDSHPNHHDVALLLTRADFCEPDGTCDLLSSSKTAGTCDPKFSCAVCEDSGLKLGYVIAHALGHTLGMEHDTAEIGCDCKSPFGGYTVMCKDVSVETDSWSNCSESYLRQFLTLGYGKCLLDPPSDYGFKLHDVLPGVMYDGMYQCLGYVNKTSKLCKEGKMCKKLSCYADNVGCISLNIPAMPGTSCRENKWCYKQKCVTKGERPGAVDGGWGQWSAWSQCSRTCDSGVSYSERLCNSPQPANGGKYCVGERKRHRVCYTKPCDLEEPSFRQVQCESYNGKIFPVTGKKHKFTAVEKHPYNPCQLYCKAKKEIYMVAPKVEDGTPCYRHLRDICIDGVCREVACDNELTSSSKEDACGICHGDGTACTVEKGEKDFKKKKGMTKFLEVPEGAMNIRVEEIDPSKSMFVVKSGKKKLLTGKQIGLFYILGSKAWIGMGRYDQEFLHIPGRVAVPLDIYILTKQDVSFRYSMGLPATEKRKPVFKWDFIDWSPCSVKCGRGIKTSTPSCIEKLSGVVEDEHCKYCTRPDPKQVVCENSPCVPSWAVGDWQECLQKSGKCVRSRIVRCVETSGDGPGTEKVVVDSQCKEEKPIGEMECPCPKRRKRGRHENYNILPSRLRRLYGYRIPNYHSDKSVRKGSDKIKKGDIITDKRREMEITIHLENGEDIKLPPGVTKPPPGTKTIVLRGDDARRYLGIDVTRKKTVSDHLKIRSKHKN